MWIWHSLRVTSHVTTLALIAILVLAGLGPQAQAQQAPQIRIDPPRVGPSYPPELIRRVIRAHLPALRACVDGGPRPSGRLPIAFTIEADGAVSGVELNERALDEPRGACIRAEFTRMRFPAPPGGGTLRVTYPFATDAGE